MRRHLVIVLPVLLAAARAPAAERAGLRIVEQAKTLPGFGAVTVYRPTEISDAHGVILFVSGDGGWNLGVVDMARRLASRAIVAGLPMPAWQRRAERNPQACWYPAGELEIAAQALEKLYELPRYVPPILVGYSSGATVVYGALAQSPPTTFRGAVSLGFCPDLEVKRRFCGSKGWTPEWDVGKRRSWLSEDRDMSERDGGGAKWIALQGKIDQVCAPSETVAFVARVPHAKVVPLEKVGHGFSAPQRWGAAFDAAVGEMLETAPVLDPVRNAVRHDGIHATPGDLAAKLDSLDLPLEVVWSDAPHAVVIFVSGDGGWAELDRGVARSLAARGVAVVGWNTLRYFWLAKSPGQFADAVAKLITALPPGMPLFAGGYSFGAETIPVIVARAPAASPLRRLAGLVLLAPGPYASFEVSPLDWLGADSSPTAYPVATALAALPSLPAICIEPIEPSPSGCAAAARPGYERAQLPGGHHFGGDYDGIASRVATFVSANSPR